MHRFALERAVRAWVIVLVCGGGVLGCTTTSDPVQDAGGQFDAGEPDSGSISPDSGSPTSVDPCTPEGMGSTIGLACESAADCDDGCFCNGAEECVGGTCVAGIDPCEDEVACTADVCREDENACSHEPQHALCSNGNACDGAEICDPFNGCRPGAALYCNDESSCTIDSCDPDVGCVHEPRDLDGDGYTDGRCGGEDCDDFTGDIFPGAVEHCMNRRDDDCDGQRDYNDSDCLPENDTCEQAVVLAGPGTYSGSTAGLASDYTLACFGSGPDAIFRFTLTESQDVTVTVSGGGTDVAVSLRPWAECASGPDAKCSDASPPSLLHRSLPPGEYAIIVKSTAGAPFDLNLRYGPPTTVPPVDVCDATTVDFCGGVPCTTLLGARFTGYFIETEDDYTLSCAAGDHRDAVYRFTIDAPKDVVIAASSGSGLSPTVLALTTDCESPAAMRRCEPRGSELRHRELQPGTYFVIVESEDRSAATYSLSVTITDPVPRTVGDACSAPIDISETEIGGGGSGSVDSSTLTFDSGTTCGGSTSDHRDATFVFTLPTTRDVTLTTSTADTWDSYFAALQTVCGDGSTTRRCWSGTGPITQSWRSLEPGTYYVTVATRSSVSGPVTAELMTRDPTEHPASDLCSGAIVLTNGSSHRGTTIGFEDNAPSGDCAPTPSQPDVFYTFTLESRSDVLINVADRDGDLSSRFTLTLRKDVCGTGEVVACETDAPATVNATLEPGTYYLQVETEPADPSDYVLTSAFFSP